MRTLEKSTVVPILTGIVLTLLVVVNIVITAVILSQQTGPVINVNSQEEGGTGEIEQSNGYISSNNAAMFGDTQIPQTRIYLIQLGQVLGAYTYFDELGYHAGFWRDLAFDVCEAAGVTCKIIIDDHTHCWSSQKGLHPVLGIGLQHRYYDACMGAAPTVERMHAARLSLPFNTGIDSVFYYRPGTAFDHKDFRGKKIGFVNGWSSNEKCIARNYPGSQGVPITVDQMVYVNNPVELASILRNGTVDAVFSVHAPEVARFMKGLDISLASLSPCIFSGGAIMSRMDSEFPDIWNKGFTKVQSNGQYKQLCEDANVKHAHKGYINCTESYAFDLS